MDITDRLAHGQDWHAKQVGVDSCVVSNDLGDITDLVGSKMRTRTKNLGDITDFQHEQVSSETIGDMSRTQIPLDQGSEKSGLEVLNPVDITDGTSCFELSKKPTQAKLPWFVMIIT